MLAVAVAWLAEGLSYEMEILFSRCSLINIEKLASLWSWCGFLCHLVIHFFICTCKFMLTRNLGQWQIWGSVRRNRCLIDVVFNLFSPDTSVRPVISFAYLNVRLNEPVFSTTVHMFRGSREPLGMLKVWKRKAFVKHGYQITQGHKARWFI